VRSKPVANTPAVGSESVVSTSSVESESVANTPAVGNESVVSTSSVESESVVSILAVWIESVVSTSSVTTPAVGSESVGTTSHGEHSPFPDHYRTPVHNDDNCSGSWLTASPSCSQSHSRTSAFSRREDLRGPRLDHGGH
jgi:hypothetical protein